MKHEQAVRLNAAALLSAAGDWQTMNSAPRDGSWLLAYTQDSDPNVWVVRFNNDGAWESWEPADGGSFDIEEFSHWRLLPPPPAE